jgi:hypothetical protein
VIAVSHANPARAVLPNALIVQPRRVKLAHPLSIIPFGSSEATRLGESPFGGKTRPPSTRTSCPTGLIRVRPNQDRVGQVASRLFCKGCVDKAKADPDKTLSTVKDLKAKAAKPEK